MIVRPARPDEAEALARLAAVTLSTLGMRIMVRAIA